jgi:hypothetical protein
MTKTICPHCGYDRSLGVIAKGAVKGTAIGVCVLFNPLLGAAALTGLAYQVWKNADKEEIQCPNCKKYYHT